MSTMNSVNFDRAAPFYDQTRGFPPGVAEQAVALMADAGSLTGDSTVLEVGVGTGRVALPLSHHVGHYIGVDISRQMMGKLREKQTREPISLSQSDATRLPFADNTFDAVTAVHVFHLIPGWQTALTEVQRVLKPKAPFLNAYGGAVRIGLISKAADEVLGSEVTRTVGVQREQYTSFLEDSGWQPHGEPFKIEFARRVKPRATLEAIEKRYWSSMWRLSDEQVTRLYEAVEQLLGEEYDDIDTPVEIGGSFTVQAYLPPG